MIAEEKEEIIHQIVVQLNDNYIENTTGIIDEFIERYLAIASYETNRDKSDSKLIPYVKNAVVMAYLRLGKETSSSNNEGGMSDNFIDIEDKLKKDVRTIRVLP